MEQRPRERTYAAFGEYVRSQRKLARLTLRQAADMARISNPYLSQIEHGLALPSVLVIGALADALHVSADTLLLRAAGKPSDGSVGHGAATEDAIRADQRLDDAQKHALLAVLTSFLSPAPAPSPAQAPSPPDDSTAIAIPHTRRRRPPKALEESSEAR